MADSIAVLPGFRGEAADRTIPFQNGLMILLGSAAQQFDFRACRASLRTAVGIRNPVHALFRRAKTAICASVYGMITG